MSALETTALDPLIRLLLSSADGGATVAELVDEARKDDPPALASSTNQARWQVAAALNRIGAQVVHYDDGAEVIRERDGIDFVVWHLPGEEAPT